MNGYDDLNKKFQMDRYLLFETEYWVWSLRPHQPTVGSGILSLKRDCPEFSKVTTEEFSDLFNIIGKIETTLKKAFKYSVINYLMLMIFDRQVHYHIIPRYEQRIKIIDKLWTDDNWPGIPPLIGEEMGEEELKRIMCYIIENLN